MRLESQKGDNGRNFPEPVHLYCGKQIISNVWPVLGQLLILLVGNQVEPINIRTWEAKNYCAQFLILLVG